MHRHSFEGQSRRRPKVSLRGASKKEETSVVLLQRNLENRRKREAERRKIPSAVIIQSFVRGYLCRLHLKAEQRAQWDARLKQMIPGNLDKHEAQELLRMLISCKDHKSIADGKRVVWLSQTLAEHRHIEVEKKSIEVHQKNMIEVHQKIFEIRQEISVWEHQKTRAQWDDRQKQLMIAGNLDAQELLELQTILLSSYNHKSDAQKSKW